MIRLFNDRIKNSVLTKTEKRIADFISDNYFNVYLMSVFELANRIGTSDTSVIRTARKLGFDSFVDMKTFIAASIEEEIKNSEGLNFLSAAARFDKQADTIQSSNLYEQMLELTQSNINDIFTKNNAETFERAAEILVSSRQKFVVGFRGCTGIVTLLAGSLCDVFKDVRWFTNADAGVVTPLLDIEKEDCLVLISYPRYAEIGKDVIEIAKDAGAKIIVMTDKMTAPMCKHADVVLLSGVESVSINNSYIGPTVVAEMLLATAYKLIGPAEQERLKKLENYISKHGFY